MTSIQSGEPGPALQTLGRLLDSLAAAEGQPYAGPVLLQAAALLISALPEAQRGGLLASIPGRLVQSASEWERPL